MNAKITATATQKPSSVWHELKNLFAMWEREKRTPTAVQRWMVMGIKVCRNCKHCLLDLKALSCGVLVDKCGVTGKIILHPFLGGFLCKNWSKEEPIVIHKDNYFIFEVDDVYDRNEERK
jgi:hypothetical protein